MIGYFIKSGDENVSDIFTPYVWREKGFDTFLEKATSGKEYGSDLKLLLIKFYVEGKFDINGPDQPKPGNYSTKNKDIAVEITVKLTDFHNRNDLDRKNFIVSSTLKAIELAREKLSKKKLDIDFDQLLSDVRVTGKKYLAGQ